MNEKAIQQLIRILRENEDVGEIEVSEGLGRKIRVSRNSGMMAVSAPSASPPPSPQRAVPAAAPGPEESAGAVQKAPMVGTFYRSPSPGEDPFITEGSRVSPGMVICIIEAMKLMNEIECEVSGTVQEILVQNGDPVEFGQALFVIEED